MLRKTLRATPCSDCIRQFGSELRGKNKDRQRDTGTRGKRLRTDLLLPRPEIGLDQQTTDVILSEVRLREITSPLWLPKVVNVYARFQGQNFKNEHHYANYRRYRVSTKVIF
jgi:hypothetical protein